MHAGAHGDRTVALTPGESSQEDPIEGKTRKAKIIEKHPRLKLTRVLQGRCHLFLREHTQLGIQSPDVPVEIRKLQIPQPA